MCLHEHFTDGELSEYNKYLPYSYPNGLPQQCMLQDMDDDDDRSSLSRLSELLDDLCNGELHQVVTDTKVVSQAVASLKDSPKCVLHKATRTPHLKMTLLRPIIWKHKCLDSQLNKHLIIHVNHDLKHWVDEMPVHRLPGVFLKKFQALLKNTIKDRIWVQEVIDEIKAWESDGASGIFFKMRWAICWQHTLQDKCRAMSR